VRSFPGTFRRFRHRATAQAAFLGLAGTLALAGTAGAAEALGFSMGSLASAAAVHLLGAQIESRAAGAPRLAASRARLGSLLRTGLRAGVLGVAYALPGVSFASAAAGLFAGPAVLLAGHLAGARSAC
jgi:hypothetical protein